jgi:hypothetical protein
MNQNPFIAWLSENLQRLFLKSPKFFKVWKAFFAFVTAIAGIPALLDAFGVVLPDPFNQYFVKMIAVAGAVGLFMSMLPTQSAIVGVDQSGQPLKKTDKESLPFTARNEEKKVEDKPVDVLTPDPSTNPVINRNSP